MANTKGKLIFTCPATSSKGRKNPPLFNSNIFYWSKSFNYRELEPKITTTATMTTMMALATMMTMMAMVTMMTVMLF